MEAEENIVLSRASHIIDSSINLFGFIRENFDGETSYKLEKKFLTAIKQMDPNKFNNGMSRIKELKRIMSLPEDFKLTGDHKQQSERVGRMVPPLMMKALAESIYKKVLKPYKELND